MKKQLLLLIAAFLLIFLAACGNDEEESDETTEQQMQDLEIKEEELVDEDSLIANVNEAEIYGKEFNNIYRQLKMMGYMYGEDVSDYEILKEEVIGILIEQELIQQDAAEQGIEVDEAVAEEEMNVIIEENGEETITMMLEQYELTEEEFRDQLMNDLTLIEYMENTIEVDVTEEELQEQFNLLQEQSEEVVDADFEEYEQRIRQNITEQKQGQALKARILELKEEADIEVLI